MTDEQEKIITIAFAIMVAIGGVAFWSACQNSPLRKPAHEISDTENFDFLKDPDIADKLERFRNNQ